MTFTEFLAARVAELERDKAQLRRQAGDLRASRDLWMVRALGVDGARAYMERQHGKLRAARA